MVTQPNFTVYVSCTRRVRPQTVCGYDLRLVHITAEQEFGTMKHWIEKERFVMISDMERAINDGLRHPQFAGGITQVAKGLWMKRDVLKVERLADYARGIGIGAVVRRLGYLLDHYGLADASMLESLRGMLTATCQRLDPLLPAEGAIPLTLAAPAQRDSRRDGCREAWLMIPQRNISLISNMLVTAGESCERFGEHVSRQKAVGAHG